MPLYDYICPDEACATKLEILLPMGDVQPFKCVTCGQHDMVKAPSVWGTYSIKGNNTASQTPKRFRGGRK